MADNALATGKARNTAPLPVSINDLVSFKDKIAESYSTGTIEDVRQTLLKLGIYVTIKQLRKFVTKWKISKHVPRKYKEHMIRKRRGRNRVDKLTGFRYREQLIPDGLLDRFISDNKLTEEDLNSLETSGVVTPQDLVYFTPGAIAATDTEIYKPNDVCPESSPLPEKSFAIEDATMTGYSLMSMEIDITSSNETSRPYGGLETSAFPAFQAHSTPASTSSQTLITSLVPVTFKDFVSILSRKQYHYVESLPKDLSQRALDCYKEHYGETISDAEKVRNLADRLWDSSRLAEAEKLDRLTIDLVKYVYGAEHPYIMDLLGNLACVLTDQGEYDKAEELETAVVVSLVRSLGENDEKTLESKANLSCTYRLQGKWKQSESLSLQVISKASSLLGEDDNLTLTAKHNLARTYCEIHRWEEARALLEHVTNARQRSLGFQHKKSLHACLTLASTLQSLGQLAKSRLLNDRVIMEISKQNIPRPVLWTFESIDNGIGQLFMTERYFDAELALRQFIPEKAKILSMRHPLMLKTKQSLAAALYYQSKTKLAIEIGREVLSSRLEVLGRNHPATITSRADLAWIEAESTGMTSFESTMEHVLSERMQTLGNDNAETLQSKMIIAWIHSQHGRWDEVHQIFDVVRTKLLEVYGKKETPEYIDCIQSMAEIFTESLLNHKSEPLLRECVTLKSKLFGVAHPETISSQLALGRSIFAQDGFEEAEIIVSLAVEQALRTYGDQHPCTLNAKETQASIKGSLGRHEECNFLREHIIESRRRLYGDNHPWVIFAQWKIADNLTEQGKYTAATKAYEEAIEASIKVFGPQHRYSTEISCSTANLKVKQLNWNEGIALYHTALQSKEKVLGRSDATVLEAKAKLAFVHIDAGDWDTGQRLFYQCFKTAKQVYGVNHPRTLNALCNIAWLRTKQNMWKVAERIYREVVKRRQSFMGKQHASTLSATDSLAWTLANQGSFPESEHLYTTVLDLRTKKLGPTHPKTLDSVFNLAWLNNEQGNLGKVRDLYQQVLTASLHIFGESATSNLAKERLASTLVNLRCFDESRVLYEQVQEWTKLHRGEDHHETAEAYLNLARFYATQGPLEKAEEYFQLAIDIFKRLNWLTASRLSAEMDLANHYSRYGRLQSAEILADEALRRGIDELKPNDPALIDARISMFRIKRLLEKHGDSHLLLTALIEQLEKSKYIDTSQLHHLRLHLCRTIIEQEKYSEAEILLDNNLSLLKQDCDKDSTLVSETLEMLASAKNALEKYEDAERYQRDALAMHERRSKSDPEAIALGRGRLGLILGAMRKYQEAEQFEESALALRRSLSPLKDSDMLQQMENLASTKEHLRKFEEAEALLLEVIEARKATNVAPDPKLAAALSQLALLKRKSCLWSKAEEIQRQALRIERQYWGYESKQYCESLRRLAACINAPDRLHWRRTFQKVVKDKSVQLYGKDSLEVINISRDLGETESLLGNYTAAIELLKEAHASRTKHPKGTMRAIMDDLLELAKTMLSAGLLEEAESIYQCAVEDMENQFIERDNLYWTAVCGLGFTKNSRGKFIEAEEIQDTVMRACRETLQRSDPMLITSLVNQLATKHELRKWQESRDLAAELLEIRLQYPGEDKPTIPELLASLKYLDGLCSTKIA